jgi:hypothetical protein
MVQTSKSPDPVKAAAGRAGMRSRWGRQRILRLDSLPEPVRAAIEAMVAAEAAARAREAADDAP